MDLSSTLSISSYPCGSFLRRQFFGSFSRVFFGLDDRVTRIYKVGGLDSLSLHTTNSVGQVSYNNIVGIDGFYV